jgi:hypothetical protein
MGFLLAKSIPQTDIFNGAQKVDEKHTASDRHPLT